MATLSLALLGAFQAHLDDEPLDGFLSNKVRALLAYLAVESAQAHSRSQLAGLLWPDWPDGAARTYLRHALANLRRILGDRNAATPFLLVARESLQFNRASAWQLDVADLERKLNHLTELANSTPSTAQLAEWEAAVARYHSPFLSGFALDDCPAYEEWILLTRERLQRRVVEALRLLADQYMRRDDLPAAIRMTRRQLELEPWLEEAHRQLMRLLARSGQRSAALAQYEQCRRQLVTELGIEPGAKTTALAAQIRTETVPARTTSSIHNTADDGEPVALSDRSQTATAQQTTSEDAHHNLPAQTTALIGREQELHALRTFLQREDVRLVTLTGPGGVGKTRLAIQAAQESAARYPDGVVFVPLAAIREPELVMSAIAQTVGIRAVGTRSTQERVQDALQDATMLLLLDNFEQVIEAAVTLGELLAACPHLTMLVTSRAGLGVYGEHEYLVGALPIPAETARLSLEQIAAYPAIDLFCQRARAARRDFMLTAANVQSVIQICARLDGLPLAIELAAARCKIFSPSALLSRLITPKQPAALRFLSATKRNLPDRHRSLWQTIAWSYDLLNPAEQALLRRLGVFVSGWTLAAAQAVSQAGVETVQDVLDGLTALVDKNLARSLVHDADEPRFIMLETIREFALISLEESSEAAAVQRRHADYYARLAEEADKHMRGRDQDQWLVRLDQEHDNLRAALTWATNHGEIELGLRIVAATFRYWVRRGLGREGFTRIETLLAAADELPPSDALADALFAAGLMADDRIDTAQKSHYFEWCIDVCRAMSNDFRLSYALALLSNLAYNRGDYARADELDEESQQISRQLGDRWNVATQLSHMGRQWSLRGEFERGRRLAEQGLALHREIGDKWGLMIALNCLGIVARVEGNLAEARACFREKLELNRELGDEPSVRWSQYDLSLIALDEGAFDQAAELLQKLVRSLDELGKVDRQADALDAVAHLAIVQERPRLALQLAGKAAALRATLGFVLPPVPKARMESLCARAGELLGAEAAATTWAEGEERALEEIAGMALQFLGN